MENQQILKHCPTHWLSLEKVVVRTLSQLRALRSYFASHNDVEKPGKVKSIHDRLQDPLTELVLNFLQYILPYMNKFNILFQAEQCMIGALLPEMDRLLRAFLVKFVQMSHVKSCHNLRALDFSNRDLQHGNERVGVGMNTRTILMAGDEEREEYPSITPIMRETFFKSVRSFYEAVVGKIVDKFPFENAILADLIVLDPSKDDLDYSYIVRLSDTFCPSVDQGGLKDEWEDYQLLSDDVKPKNNKTDIFWGELFQLRTALGVKRFPLMEQVYAALLCLPHSNADSERVFSHVRKINTEYRKTMGVDTLTALLQVKLNCDDDCFKVKPSSDLIKSAKSATSSCNKQHCSDD